MENCLFCKIINKEIPSSKVYEDEKIYAFKDINPVSPSHILLIPKKHITSVLETSDSDREILGELILASKKIAKEKGIDEFRIVINNGIEAGQTVFHLHLHLMGGRRFTWPPG